ncbi:MAG TPA: hypothetical protein PKN33_13855 [Phycisphaerae bacterium]|nr:hypothetical protein [Phycisphaerae bacterium]
MDPELSLAATGYEQVSTGYTTAVEVTKFTWSMFYARAIALLTAAGYICVNHSEFWWVATLLLMANAGMTFVVTSRQMEANQIVIRKCMAAGIELERRHNAFGYRFRLDGLGGQINELSEQNATVAEVLAAADAATGVPFQEVGVTPKTTTLCRCYATAFVLLAFITMFAH